MSPTRGCRAEAGRRWSPAPSALSSTPPQRDLDVIVVIRGGGARNELATFDAEPIALAIAAAPVPVLTGLGHEIDRSVADEVAHTVAEDPHRLRRARWSSASAQYLAAVEQRCGADRSAAADVELDRPTAALLDRAHRIARRTHAAVERADERLGTRVDRVRPRRRAAARRCRPTRRRPARRAAACAGRRQLLAAEDRHLDGLEARLALLDPVNVLARGWSITRDRRRRAGARRSTDVAAGDHVSPPSSPTATLASRVEPDEEDHT